MRVNFIHLSKNEYTLCNIMQNFFFKPFTVNIERVLRQSSKKLSLITLYVGQTLHCTVYSVQHNSHHYTTTIKSLQCYKRIYSLDYNLF